MRIPSLDWQVLTIHQDFSNLSEDVDFFDFQPNAKKALDLFLQDQFGSVLVLKTEVLAEFIHSIQNYLPQTISSLYKSDFNKNSLFGYYFFHKEKNKSEYINGILQEVNNGILILDINSLLQDITQWDKLKQALSFGFYNSHSINPTPYQSEEIKSNFKLILVGDRDDISLLMNYDDNLYQFAQYAEVNSYLTIDKENIRQWGNYVQTSAKQQLKKSFTALAVERLLQFYVRESESRQLISISPTLLHKHLLGINKYAEEKITPENVDTYFMSLEKQSSVLNEYTLQDILSNQIYIDTDKEEIGQINGLSVIEFDGIPHSFGEPLRISCNIQYGDGEIHDIERKVELGGNIHSKGIILAQSCLASLLEFPTQLPFSASIAFEQSYAEIDGDSSSLAIFCVLVSALAKLPLPQFIAVTGAIDQFGNVLSVGGVNQKIESFFKICEARGLTGKQGVVIPSACLSHLSLNQYVIEAVRQSLFNIWIADNVLEVTELLLGHSFYANENSEPQVKEPLFNLIHQNIVQHDGYTSGHFLTKFCKIFRFN